MQVNQLKLRTQSLQKGRIIQSILKQMLEAEITIDDLREVEYVSDAQELQMRRKARLVRIKQQANAANARRQRRIRERNLLNAVKKGEVRSDTEGQQGGE